MVEPILVGRADELSVELLPRMANRHGLVAGATGTGKTVSALVLAHAFSDIGVPSFIADVKGDVAGLSQPGVAHPRIDERARLLGLDDFVYRAAPVVFWDTYGKRGHALRATISDMGPLLLSRLMSLTQTQEAVLYVAFRVADENGLLLLDLKDLRAVLGFLDENRDEIGRTYGRVGSASIAAIQRGLLVLEQEGADAFFGEPMLDLHDLMRTDAQGRGMINVLAAETLINRPKLYATSLLWLLAELFQQLPEVGDPDKPKLVFFFDEAHLLFDDAPRALVEKIERVVRLIRSKGVGIYFISQNPLDIPDAVLGQLGNRIQHALRAYTIKDQRAVRASAQTFRANPAFDVETAITDLGVGEALVSTLDARGAPAMVQRTLIRPPATRLDAITDAERARLQAASPIGPRYDTPIDRESAHEILTARAKEKMASETRVKEEEAKGGGGLLDGILGRGGAGTGARRGRQGVGEAFTMSVARSVGSSVGRSIARGILGSIFK